MAVSWIVFVIDYRKKGYFKRIIEIRLIHYSEEDELLSLLKICVVIITNFCKSSKLKSDKLYSNSQGTLFRVNFALNLENSVVLWFEKFLSKLLIISSTLSNNTLIYQKLTLKRNHLFLCNQGKTSVEFSCYCRG